MIQTKEGRVTQEIDALGNHRDKEYDLFGQLSKTINERKGETSYVYDKANRLRSIISAPIHIYASPTHQDYEYDAAGHLIRQIDATGNVTSYIYDAQGNQSIRIQATGSTTYYEYDDAGHKTLELDANNNVMSWRYDDNGRLVEHKDLGQGITYYSYNNNGLLLTEQSTRGKSLKYAYYSDGQLLRYRDNARDQRIDYAVDAEGQVISKLMDYPKWIRELEQCEYDALGRLVQVKRYTTDDMRERLSVDYSYDTAGNIRSSSLTSNYNKYSISRQDYFTYDAANRVLINKGQLINGNIQMTAAQGSSLSYDEAGNLVSANKYEGGVEVHYGYEYNTHNLLKRVHKNGIDFQTKLYDKAGRVAVENLYDNSGKITQRNHMVYVNGQLQLQETKDRDYVIQSRAYFEYDAVGNLKTLTLREIQVEHNKEWLKHELRHRYAYELRDGYQQSIDEATLMTPKEKTTGSTCWNQYDVNGQLEAVIEQKNGDSSTNKTSHYFNSNIDGIQEKKNLQGETRYFNVAGKTIGDVRLDPYGVQTLEVYGGFTPTGAHKQTGFIENQQKEHSYWSENAQMEFFQTPEGEAMKQADAGILPNLPQDNLGAYTIQAGDTLESIAMQVYGDSSLWYLIADANGITDKSASAGEKGGQLHIGMRLNLPPVSSSQHHNSTTRKHFDWIGDISVSPPLPAPIQHSNFFQSIVVGVVMVLATVMVAGLLGVLTGGGGLAALGTAGLKGIMTMGWSVLAGTAAGVSPVLSTGAALTAGFVGSCASQGMAIALGIQHGFDLDSALITAFSSGATAALGSVLAGSHMYKTITKFTDQLTQFSIKDAATMMAKDAMSQGFESRIRGHHAFDWKELAIQGAAAGVLGGSYGKEAKAAVKQIEKTGIVAAEIEAVAKGGANAAVSGGHFDAVQVLGDNLGSAVGNAVVDAAASIESSPVEPKEDEKVYKLSFFERLFFQDKYEKTLAQQKAAAAEAESVSAAENKAVEDKSGRVTIEEFLMNQAMAKVTAQLNAARGGLGETSLQGDSKSFEEESTFQNITKEKEHVNPTEDPKNKGFSALIMGPKAYAEGGWSFLVNKAGESPFVKAKGFALINVTSNQMLSSVEGKGYGDGINRSVNDFAMDRMLSEVAGGLYMGLALVGVSIADTLFYNPDQVDVLKQQSAEYKTKGLAACHEGRVLNCLSNGGKAIRLAAGVGALQTTHYLANLSIENSLKDFKTIKWPGNDDKYKYIWKKAR